MKDIYVGFRVGHLTVVSLEKEEKRGRVWLCKCDCGNVVSIKESHITKSKTRNPNQSCGCKKFKQNKLCINNKRLYYSWREIMQRCYNDKNSRYSGYGGRGITVCDEWKTSFSSFLKWAIENGYSDELTIDRIDNNGNYDPQNCRWASYFTQAQNRGILKNNKTGFTGVCKHKNGYRSYIMRDGTRKHLGIYKNIEDAINARKIAESQYDLGKGS